MGVPTMIGIGLLDIKKWYSWAVGIYAFITFLLVGLGSTGKIGESIQAGLAIAFFVMIIGAVTHSVRESAKKMIQNRPNPKGKKRKTNT